MNVTAKTQNPNFLIAYFNKNHQFIKYLDFNLREGELEDLPYITIDEILKDFNQTAGEKDRM